MAMIQFLRGTQSGLAAKETINGALYFTTDTHKIYMGTETGKQEFSAIEVVSAVSALPSVATAIKGKFYYAEAENVFCFPYNGEWKQVNPDTGATSIEVVDGGGNAISAASYDASTRKITLTRGVTFTTPNVVDSKISDKVGELKIGETSYATVKAYVDEKTSGIATDAALTELAGKVGTLEGKVDVDSVSDSITAAKTAVLGQADYTGTVKGAYEAAQAAKDIANSKVTMAEVEAKDYATKDEAKGYADGKDAAIAAAKSAADAAQADVDALEGKVGTVPENKTVVGMIGDVETAYKNADTALDSRISTIEGDYLKNSDKTALQGNIDKKVNKTDYDAKVSALETADTTLQNNINAEKTAREEADSAQVTRIAALESQITGLSGAMHFEGVKKEVPADVTGYEAGDVIIVGAKEYVFNGTAFVEFGDVSAEGERIAALEDTVGKAAEGDNPATGLIKDIADNAKAIAAEKSRAEGAEAANKAAAEAAKAAAKAAQDDVDAIAADYLKAADKNTLQGNIDTVSGRVTTLEGTSHTHANKALLDTYTQTEADLADAVAKKHSHANATVLDGITADKVSAWDAAESNAKTYADGIVAGEKTRAEAAEKANADAITTEANRAKAAEKANADAIKALQTGKADKATTLSGYGITDAYTKTETYTQAQVDALLAWGEF